MLTEAVTVTSAGASLAGDLVLPDQAPGIVLFAHGSGSSRHSPRNRAVAAVLNDNGLGTLLIDLLTMDEERADAPTGKHRFDIGLLSRRLTGAVDWLALRAADLSIGVFGASTGAAAALTAAADRPDYVKAVVSRGGRPDLTDAATLARVKAPVLLLVGGRDRDVLRLNRVAAEQLTAFQELEVIPDATHLFEEPGALEQVADSAARWFTRWLPGPASTPEREPAEG